MKLLLSESINYADPYAKHLTESVFELAYIDTRLTELETYRNMGQMLTEHI